jgi:RNA polymerase sigma factor
MFSREIDKKAVQALKEKNIFECFLKEQEFYILKCAFKVTNRYITKNDDEWAVSLEAFSQAVNNYNYEKGSFLSFAELVIQRRLIDYLKKQTKYNSEILVDPIVFSGEPNETDEEKLSVKAEILEKITVLPDHTLKDEIEAVTEQLLKYGFSFYDLIACSPKSKKTRAACSLACEFIISNHLLIEMRNTKNLPLKIIEKNIKVPRKILERHRKYIIAVSEIISSDYPLLKEYLRTFREEYRQ